MEEKTLTLEERIFEFKETMKQLIVQSNLSPSIVEMVVRDIYIEVRQLSEQNLMRILNEKKKEVDDNGKHTTVS